MTTPNTGPRPRFAAPEALVRAIALLGRGTYKLGARDVDAAREVFDCFSFAVRYCYGLAGHRPGYNRDWRVDPDGVTPSVQDDMNSNSAIEDALHGSELFEIVNGIPRVGDIAAYPTIPKIRRPDGTTAGPWVGHAQMVSGVSRALIAWNPKAPKFDLLDVIECHGPDNTHPAIRRNTAIACDRRNAQWPKRQHRAFLLRVKP